jgi:hypothetical protein
VAQWGGTEATEADRMRVHVSCCLGLEIHAWTNDVWAAMASIGSDLARHPADGIHGGGSCGEQGIGE